MNTDLSRRTLLDSRGRILLHRLLALTATLTTAAAIPSATAKADTPDITGVVHAPDGTTPVAGATVSIADSSGHAAASDVVTGAGGTFSFSVAAGSYTIQALRPDPDPNYWVTNTAPVTVTATTAVQQVSVALLAPTVTGQVSGPGGAPVADAIVSADSMSGPGSASQPPGSVAVSDSNGGYGLSLGPGSYMLLVTSPSPNNGNLVGQSVALSVPATGTATKDIALQTANLIGTVVDPSGQPVAQAEVTATNADGSVNQVAPTDSSGTYLFHLGAGTYQITAQPPSDDTAGWAAGAITVDLGADVSKGNKVSLQTPTLTGKVLTPGGSGAVAGALVTAVSDPVTATPPPPGSNSQSASNGVYGLALPAGSWTVTVTPPAGSPYVASTTTVKLPVTGSLDLSLATADVSGTVYEPNGSTAVPWASLEVVDSNGNHTPANAGADGTYALNLAPGQYTITATEPGGQGVGQPATIKVNVVSGSTLTAQNIDLAAPSVTGVVTEADGRTPVSAAVYAYDTATGIWSQMPVLTGSDGSFGMAMPPGTYRLEALTNTGSSRSALSGTVTVTAGSTQTVKLAMPAAAPPAFQFDRLTTGFGGDDANGSSSGASISADGSKVAFISTATNLTLDDTLAGGASGAFLYDAGSHAVTFLGPASDIGISPSGKYVAFVSNDSNLPGNSGGDTGVWEEDLTAPGTTPTRVDNLSGAPSMSASGTAPSVSDDGNWVGFAAYGGSGTVAYLADVKGGQDLALTDPAGAPIVADPAVSADGSTVDFVSYGTAFPPSYSLDSYSTATHAATTRAAMGSGPTVPPFALSADGATVAFGAYAPSGTGELHLWANGADKTLPIFDGFGLSADTTVSAVGLDMSGDVFFGGASGAVPAGNSEDEVWTYHPGAQTTTLDSAESDGSPVQVPTLLEGVSADGSRILVRASGDSLAPGAAFSLLTNLFLGVPYQATAPAWPANASVSPTEIGSQLLRLTWTPVADPALAAYRIFANGTQVAEVPAGTTTYTLTGLTPSTSYQLQIQAGGADGLWSTDGPTVAVTTASASGGASVVASVSLQPGGTVKVSWPAAAGTPNYRVFRSVNGAKGVALTPDTSAISVVDLPPASSVVSYTVSTVDAADVASPYAVGDHAVTTPGLTLSSVAWKGDTLQSGGAQWLKQNSKVQISAVGSTGRTVTATVAYLAPDPTASTSTASAHRVTADLARVIPRLAPHTVTTSAQQATVALTEDPTAPGTYSGSFTLPAGATRLVSVTATLADGAGATRTASADGLPLPVAGAMSVEVDAPAGSLTGGQVVISSLSDNYWQSAPVAGGGTVLLDAPPGSDYQVQVSDAAGRTAYQASDLSVVGGVVTPVSATPDFPATLDVTVTTADTRLPVANAWVDAWGTNGGYNTAYAHTDGSGVAHITGLFATAATTPVSLSVALPRDSVYAAPDTLSTVQMGIGPNSASISVQPLPKATVKGTVTDPYGEPDPDATVQITSTVSDGRDFSFSGHTDASGHYSVDVLAGSLGIAAGSPTGWSGSSQATVAPLQTVSQDVALKGDVPYTVGVAIQTQALGSNTPVPLPQLDWREAYHFGFHAETSDGSYYYDSIASPGQIRIEGHKGEVVKACANGAQAQLSPAESCSTVTLGSEPNGSAVVSNTGQYTCNGPCVIVTVAAPPVVSANLVDDAGQPITGSWTATLTDESAKPPSVVGTLQGSGADLEMPVSAPVGSYRLALRSASLYADVPVDVSQATKTDLGTVTLRSSNWFTPDAVPEDNTVTATPAQALPGDVVTFRSQFVNNGTDLTGLVASIDQPKGATILPASVTLDGQPAPTKIAADGGLTVDVGDLAHGATGVIAYTVTLASGLAPGSSVGGALNMAFTAGGKSETEALQSGEVRVAGLTLAVPGQTNQLQLVANGRAPAGASVQVYSDGTLMATATSSPGGYWQAPVDLPDRGTYHYYDLHAESALAGQTLRSADSYVYFDSSAPVVQQVSLWQDDPRNPNGRRFTFDPAAGVAHFPFVWVPGQTFHVAVTFTDPSAVQNVTVQVGSGSDPQPATLQPDNTYLATWSNPDPGDGSISVGFDAAPQNPDYASLAQPTLPEVRSQLPKVLQDFSDPVAQADPNNGSSMQVSTSLPSLAGGLSETGSFSLVADNYTPTSADLAQYQADGIPLVGHTVSVNPDTGVITVSGHIPISALPADASSVSGILRAHLSLPSSADGWLAATFESNLLGKANVPETVGAMEVGGASAADLASLGNDIRQTVLGQNYTQLDQMTDEVSNCTDYASIIPQIEDARTQILAWDAFGGASTALQAVAASKFLAFAKTQQAAYLVDKLGLSSVEGLAEAVAKAGSFPRLSAASAIFNFASGQVINNWFNDQENKITDPVQSLIDHCPKFPGAKGHFRFGPGHHSGPLGGMTPIEDPSGYAYAGLPSNRLSGVTATLLYSQSQSGPWSAWDATWYGQQNPLTTDGEGRYAWNVPAGWWKVQFTDPGYQTAFSPPEQVPPPQYGVNVGMVALAPPALASATQNADGTISATFSQYMKTATVNAADLVVTDASGRAVPGTVSAVAADKDPSGTELAQTFVFKPTGALPGGALKVTAAPPGTNYAGTLLTGAAGTRVSGGSVGTPPGVPVGTSPGGTTYTSSPLPPSSSNTLVVSVTPPVSGLVTIQPTSSAPAAPAGFVSFGPTEQITAPQASTAAPLSIAFEIDRSAIPAGTDDSELTVLRDGVAAGSCPGATTVGAVDPCVTSVVDHGSYLTITVLSTHASTWSVAAPVTDRIAGPDRIGTSVATSQAWYGSGQATAAVLARDDSYADALTGAPLAAAKGGPLLLSDPSSLPVTVAAELSRILAPGSTVYLLGGVAALSAGVAQAVGALGFQVQRVFGADRYATAVAVAHALGDPSQVLLASGADFPDALAAGAAAAHVHGAVLLTDGNLQSTATEAWLSAHPGATVYAVGGPASRADAQVQAVVGQDRYATAVAVARQFFPAATSAGLASGLSFADALSAGPVLGAHGQPLLLTDPASLSAPTASYIGTGITQLHIFGGPAAVTFTPAPTSAQSGAQGRRADAVGRGTA